MATDVSAVSGGGIRVKRRGLPFARQATSASFGLSPQTLAAIRWTQVLGQLVTVLVVAFGLGIELPLVSLLVLVGIGAATTLWATRQLTPPHRLDESQLGSILLLDAAQIGAMLALTGALGNPFALFLLFPAILAATTLNVAWCMTVCSMVVLVASALAFVPAPVLWSESVLRLPPLFVTGTWAALCVGTALIATYAWRIAEEGRRMGRALAAIPTAFARP